MATGLLGFAAGRTAATTPLGNSQGSGALAALQSTGPADPDTFTDKQGRVFKKRIDPASGHLFWEHKAEQSDQAGNRLKVNITIDVAPDGTMSRTEAQRLDRANGDAEEANVTTHFDANGARVREVSDTLEKTSKEGVLREERQHIVGKIKNDEVVQQHLDMVVDERAGTEPGETVVAKTTVSADWDNGGAPVTKDVVPVLRRQSVATYTTPGQGLHKTHPRVVTQTQTASGPANALKHEPLHLVVRFEGKGGQYMERHIEVPVNEKGEPNNSASRVTKNIDKQSGVDKTLMQARIWGPLVSNIALIVGVNLLRTNAGGIGKALVAGSLAASGASLTGEGHALLTKRNDGSVPRLAMAAYDTVWTGLFTALVFGSPGARLAATLKPQMGAIAAGVGASSVLGRFALDQTAADGAHGVGSWGKPAPAFSAELDMPTAPLGIRNALSNDLASITERGTEALGRRIDRPVIR